MKVRFSTSHGEFSLALDSKKAPKTVENFLAYVNDGHYDGTIFHRVVSDFVIQGGGLDENMQEKPTRPPIRNEANNGLSNLLGTVAMARMPDPHSASAQFFINLDDNPFLDFSAETDDGWGYCVFGEVVDGMDTVEAIGELPTTTRKGFIDVPEETVMIKKVSVLEG